MVLILLYAIRRQLHDLLKRKGQTRLNIRVKLILHRFLSKNYMRKVLFWFLNLSFSQVTI